MTKLFPKTGKGLAGRRERMGEGSEWEKDVNGNGNGMGWEKDANGNRHRTEPRRPHLTRQSLYYSYRVA